MRVDNMVRCTPPAWMLMLLALLLWGGEFVRRGLWEPDEARYAYVAREMHEGGHWFVPHIHGEPYPDKPPLMFWLINASSLLTGGRINGVSARLPSLFGSFLTMWAMTRLLARWHSTQAAWRAVLVLTTSFLFWKSGGWGQIDALLCGLMMMSLYFFFTAGDSPGQWRFVLAYLFAGLAILAKGPVGLAIPMGAYAAGMWATGDRQALRRTHWIWGPAVALAIPGLWLLMAYLQQAPREYFASMFGEKSFGRVTASRGHDRPFYFFISHFAFEFLPWTILLPGAIHCMSDRPLRRRLLAWGLFVIGLFSLFVCKRNVYILPAYPVAAMLIGAAWADVHRLSPRWTSASGWMATGLLVIIGVATTAAIFVPQIPFDRLVLIPSAVVVVAGSTLLVRIFLRERLSECWFYTFSGTLLINQLLVGAVVMPALNPLKSPGAFGEAAQQRLAPDQPVYIYQDQLAIIPLYANRPGKVLKSEEEVNEVLHRDKSGVIVFRAKQWEELKERFGDYVTPHAFDMGHKTIVWAEFGFDDDTPDDQPDAP